MQGRREIERKSTRKLMDEKDETFLEVAPWFNLMARSIGLRELFIPVGLMPTASNIHECTCKYSRNISFWLQIKMFI